MPRETGLGLVCPTPTVHDALPFEITCVACDLALPNLGSVPSRFHLRITTGPSVDSSGVVVTIITGIAGELHTGDRRAFQVEQANFGTCFAKASYDPANERLGLFLPIVLHEDPESPPFAGVLIGEITDMRGTPKVGALRFGFADLVATWFPCSRAVDELDPRAVTSDSDGAGDASAEARKPGQRCCSGAFKCRCCEGEMCFAGACTHRSCSSCLPAGCSDCLQIGCPMTCACAESTR